MDKKTTIEFQNGPLRTTRSLTVTRPSRKEKFESEGEKEKEDRSYAEVI